MGEGLGGAAIVAAVAAIIGAGTAVYTSEKQAQTQGEAMEQSKKAARAQRDQASSVARTNEEAQNKANAKKPDIASILAAAEQASKAGASGTMLTGPGGIGGALPLGKSSLLGS